MDYRAYARNDTPSVIARSIATWQSRGIKNIDKIKQFGWIFSVVMELLHATI
jgi:hypothetical protein